ncbi:MAG: hypothetical protein ACKO34_02035, partial [Vampirovibrionales bacterium]
MEQTKPIFKNVVQAWGLSLILAAFLYASPINLVPATHDLHKMLSPDIVNLYTAVAWMGLIHFWFSWQGQLLALSRQKQLGWIELGWIVISFIVVGVCFTLKFISDGFLFNALVWIYFSSHFFQAESFLNRRESPLAESSSRGYLGFVIVAFAYLSWVLLFPLTLPHAHSIMLIIAGVILTVAWLKGVFRFLADP